MIKLEKNYDFEKIRDIYIDVVANTPTMKSHTQWVYGKHPTDETIRKYVDGGEMFTLSDGDEIVGVVAIPLKTCEDYKQVKWGADFGEDETAELHILAVLPKHQGKGYGKILVEKSVEYAKEIGKRAVRLDTLTTNITAQKMYREAGFTLVEKKNLYTRHAGYVDYLYYEIIF